MTKSQDPVVRRVCAPCLALLLAVSSAEGDDGITFPDDFDYSKGYSMAAFADGGGWNAGEKPDRSCFSDAIWKSSADAELAVATTGKNYFQNGNQLNCPWIVGLSATEAAPYLAFPGDKLVLGSKDNGTDPYSLALWGSVTTGENGLLEASGKPYLFGGAGLVMAGSCLLSLQRHGAISGTLTVLSDDHNTYRVNSTNASNFLSHNVERWTKTQCSRIEPSDVVNGWSIDIQAALVGDARAFLCFHRAGQTKVEPSRPNVCQFQGDNTGWYGTLAVESNCVLRFKTSLPNGAVKVGYRGWGMPAYTGTTGNQEYLWDRFDPLSAGSGTLEVPSRSAVAVGSVENNCGCVRVAAGSSLTVGGLVYKGGEFRILVNKADGCGKVTVQDSFMAVHKPIRIVPEISGASSSVFEIFSFPTDSGLTEADFAVASDGGCRPAFTTANGVTTISMLRMSLVDGEKVTLGSIDLTGASVYMLVSGTLGESSCLTVTDGLKLDASVAPLHIGLTGSVSAMPQGEMVPLLRWPTATSSPLDVCDFDLTLSRDLGITGVGRGYPVVKDEDGVSTLYLDCTEVLYGVKDSATLSCYTNAAGWADRQMPHVDANYYGNGYALYSIKSEGAMLFPDGTTVPYQEFHGNRLRLGRNEALNVEGFGRTLNFPGEGLVLQQGGRLDFSDPEIVIAGKMHIASLFTRALDPGEQAYANVSAFRNSASNRRTNTYVPAELTGDRRAELTLQQNAWSVANGYDVFFSGDSSGYYGTLICETNTAIYLDRGLPNGTVKLGYRGLPLSALGSLDNDNNGTLSVTVSGAVISISNLVVNGATVVATNGNSYVLKSLTLNGGKVLATAKDGTAVLSVEGRFVLTHKTTFVLQSLPRSGCFMELVSWPASESDVDMAKLKVVDAFGRSLDPAKYKMVSVADASGRHLRVAKERLGYVISIR